MNVILLSGVISCSGSSDDSASTPSASASPSATSTAAGSTPSAAPSAAPINDVQTTNGISVLNPKIATDGTDMAAVFAMQTSLSIPDVLLSIDAPADVAGSVSLLDANSKDTTVDLPIGQIITIGLSGTTADFGDIKRVPAVGEKVALTLHFRNAGKVPASFTVYKP